MGNNNNYFQVQDTITTKGANINTISSQEFNPNLKVERATIEMVELRSLTIDSARLQPKQIRAIIKTVPYVPVDDSIEQPIFNVLNDNFILHDSSSFFDELNFTPIEPGLKLKVVGYNKNVTVAHPATNDLVLTKELLTNDLFVIDKLGEGKGFYSTDWMLGIIIFILVLFGWLRVGYGRYIQTAIQAAYNYFTARRIFEEANVTRSRVFYFMNFLFFINISLFVTQVLEYNHFTIFKLHGIILFFIIFAAILLIYTVKSLVLRLLDFVFLTRGGFSSYLFIVFIYNKMVGFVLLPIIAILPFVPGNVTPYLIYAGGLIIIILYLFRVFKGLQLGIKNRLSIFYLILYLCALEILPVLVLLKVTKPFI
jgi:hypothetical protein